MRNTADGLEKFIVAERMQAEQRRIEGGAFSLALHIIFLLFCLWNTRETGLGSGRENGGGLLARGPVEVTILEEHVDSGTAEKPMLTDAVVAPTVPAAPAEKIVGYEEFKEKMAEISRAQKEKQLMREIEEQKAKEAAAAAAEAEKAKAMAEQEAHVRRQEEQQQALRRLSSDQAVDRSLVEQNSNASGSDGDEDADEALLGGGGVAVNIHEWGGGSGRTPCPSNREYYNPGDDCRPYKQQLYEPMCVYDLKSCQRILKRLLKFK